MSHDIPILQQTVGGVWKKEDELKQLKSEVAALERKIQLELAPPKNEAGRDNNVSADRLQVKTERVTKSDSFAEHINHVKPIIDDKTHIFTKGLTLG